MNNDLKIEKIIKNGNLEELKREYKKGLDLNKKLKLEYYEELPINLALDYKQFEIAKWLAEQNVELNDHNEPTITMVAQKGNKELIKFFIKHGAKINLTDRVGNSALSAAIYSENEENVKTIIENGIDMKLYGGDALIQAASDGNLSLVKLLVENGVDIDYQIPNSVYNGGSTPLMTAICYKIEEEEEKIATYLIQKGADVTLKNKYGERAYHFAKEHKSENLKKIIASKEPSEWHDFEKRKIYLKKIGTPSEIISLLEKGPTKVACPSSRQTDYIVFGDIFDVLEFRRNGKTLLNLLIDVEGYGSLGMLLWSVEDKCFATFDLEHDWFGLLKNVTLDDILMNTSHYIDLFIEK